MNIKQKKEPFLQEFDAMVERLNRRDDFTGTVQISAGRVSGKWVYMVTSSDTQIVHENVQLALEKKLNELCVSDDQTHADGLHELLKYSFSNDTPETIQ